MRTTLLCTIKETGNSHEVKEAIWKVQGGFGGGPLHHERVPVRCHAPYGVHHHRVLLLLYLVCHVLSSKGAIHGCRLEREYRRGGAKGYRGEGLTNI